MELARESEGVLGAWDQNCGSSTGASFTGRGNLAVDLDQVGGSVVDAAILACAIEGSAGLRFEGGGSFIDNRLEQAEGTPYNEQLEKAFALQRSGRRASTPRRAWVAELLGAAVQADSGAPNG
jgi:hypothetical protein